MRPESAVAIAGAPASRRRAVHDTPWARRRVAVWLLVCAALVAAMVVLGGLTRLTGSGLSMVTWHPVHGVVPPLDADAWAEEFARYKASPEYREVNFAMSLDDFKRIYWFEYAHRILGRTVGLVFLVPFLYMLARRWIEPRRVPALIAIFALGGLQGLVGWWMVRSGLVDVPHVSAYRLAVHLALAVALYCALLWSALALLAPSVEPAGARSRLAGPALAVLVLAVVTALSGAFVAGLDAGLVYNTFPRMGAHWVPPEIGALTPWWRNLFENVATVQFDHRVLAVALALGVLALWLAVVRSYREPAVRRWGHAALAATALQIGLGVATLLTHVPVSLGALHQGNALVVLTALLGLVFALRRGVEPTAVAAGTPSRA